MSDLMSSNCTERTERLFNSRSSQFIEDVREEEHCSKIHDHVFMQSTMENPYIRKIRSTTDLCNEMKEDVRQKFLDDKRRQKIRESNQELKQLEVQIRAACCRKVVCAQIYEKEALDRRKEVLIRECNLGLELARLRIDEAAEKAEQEKKAKRKALRQDLQEQIAMSNVNRMKKYEQVLEDRKNMDEVERKTREDMEKEARKAIENQLKLKADRAQFLQAKAEWKITHQQAKETENEKAKEVVRQRELKLQREEKEKKELQRRNAEISEKIGQRTYELASEKIKRNEFLVELLAEEAQAKDEMRERKELERQKQQQIILRNQFVVDREEKEYRKQIEKNIDDEFMQEQMRIFAENEKLFQLSDEKRRRKQSEYRRALQNSLDERKRLKAETIKKLQRLRDMDLNEAKMREQQIEDERIHMLKELDPTILQFLAPGVLRHSDREFLSIPPRQN